MVDYDEEILEENKEIIDKYAFETHDKLFFVQYFLGRDYTFGYDYIHVYFRHKMQALIFLMKHKEQCMPKKND